MTLGVGMGAGAGGEGGVVDTQLQKARRQVEWLGMFPWPVMRLGNMGVSRETISREAVSREAIFKTETLVLPSSHVICHMPSSRMACHMPSSHTACHMPSNQVSE